MYGSRTTRAQPSATALLPFERNAKWLEREITGIIPQIMVIWPISAQVSLAEPAWKIVQGENPDEKDSQNCADRA
jgi:hypothetical protein